MNRIERLVGTLAACGLAACAHSSDDLGGGGDAPVDGGGVVVEDPDSGTAVRPDAAPVIPPDAAIEIEILPANIIDDLDDGDSLIAARGGRVGTWYAYNDQSATGVQFPAMGGDFMPTAGGPAGVGFMAETTGSGFTVWGAGIGVDLNSEDMVKSTYDASGFTGIAFRARGNTDVRVAIAIEGVVGTDSGGTCVASDEVQCFDTHGRSFFITDQWRQYLVPFDQIFQGGWGLEVPFDASKVMSVQFQMPPSVDFAVALDDIGFY